LAARRREQLVVRRPGNAIDDVGVTLDLGHHLRLVDVPDPNGLVLARRREELAILVEGDAVDRPGMAGGGLQLLATGEVPQLHLAVEARGGEAFAVGMKRKAVDESGVTLQLFRGLSGSVEADEEQSKSGGATHGRSPQGEQGASTPRLAAITFLMI